MKLRLTRSAARQLDYVLSYIDQHSPQGARKVQERIQVVMHLLLRHPHAGHATSRQGLRRIVVTPYPYAVTYRVANNEIIIRSVRHTARRPIV